ncbi:MAG TPA: MW1434 family type I TA system toxin [Candidatus Paceibacterota bacterium]
MKFEEVLPAARTGKHIARSGWNGKGMWVASQAGLLAEDWQIV